MPQPILIEFTTDLTAVEKAIDSLEQLGLVDKKTADEFRKTSAQVKEHNANLEKTGKAADTVKIDIQEMVDAIKQVPKKIVEDSAKKSLDDAGKETEKLTNKTISLKTELKNAKAEMSNLELAGKQGSARYRELALRAGQLEDQIGDTSARVRILASDTRNLDAALSVATGVAGAFAIAQGAAGLFGSENEELQKTMLKVQSALALVNGLTAVSETLNKDSAASVMLNAYSEKIYGYFVDQTTGKLIAQRVASAALATVGIGVLIAAVVIAYKEWQKWNDRMEDAANTIDGLRLTSDEYTKIMTAGAQATAGVAAELNAYLTVAKNVHLSDDQRNTALKFLNDKYGEYLGKLTQDNIDTQAINDKIKDYIQLRYQQAVVDAYASVITDREKTFIEAKTEAQREHNKEMITANRINDKTVAEKIEAKYQEEVTKKTGNHAKVMEELNNQMTEQILKLTELQSTFKTVTDAGDGFDDAIAGIQLKLKEADGDLVKQIELNLELLAVKKKQIQADEDLSENQKKLRISDLEDTRKYLEDRKAQLTEVAPEPIQLVQDPKALATEVVEPSIKIIEDMEQRLKDAEDRIKEQTLADIQEVREARAAAYAEAVGIASQGLDAIGSLESMAYNNSITALDEMLANKQISQEEYDRRAAEAKHKQAVQEKTIAVFKALLNIPTAVLEGLVRGGIPLSILFGAIATAEAAAVIGTKVPGFIRGNERLKGGRPYEDSILAMLAPGERVVTAEVNEEYYPILSKIHNRQIPAGLLNTLAEMPSFAQIAAGLGGGAIVLGPGATDIDYKRMGQAVGNEIAKLPLTSFHWDLNGIYRTVTNGTTRVKYYEDRYSSN